MVVNKSNIPRCKLRIRDTKIKPAEKFKYLGSILIGNRKSNTKIQRDIAITKRYLSKN